MNIERCGGALSLASQSMFYKKWLDFSHILVMNSVQDVIPRADFYIYSHFILIIPTALNC